ncbi:hypothetical protein ONQ97_27015, partial [Salmonella enterica subsp. enterica serovar Virginia]|nr:hypothetical protein [Salmonella enterica subsp. enterica serovar Virginia]
NDSNPGVWALASNEYVALTNTFPTRTTFSVGDGNGPVAFTTAFQPSFAGPQPDSRIDRTTFIRRAYLHLAGAIVVFIVLSAAW